MPPDLPVAPETRHQGHSTFRTLIGGAAPACRRNHTIDRREEVVVIDLESIQRSVLISSTKLGSRAFGHVCEMDRMAVFQLGPLYFRDFLGGEFSQTIQHFEPNLGLPPLTGADEPAFAQLRQHVKGVLRS